MRKQRVTFQIQFSTDLDPIPGWGNDPDDWKAYIIDQLMRQHHYNPTVKILSAKVD
jgi:hypothetical protein